MKRKVAVAIFAVLVYLFVTSTVSAQTSLVEVSINNAYGVFDGAAYSWAGGAHCSTFVSTYLENLGFQVEPNNDGLSAYSPQYGSALPESNTLKQVKWFLMHDQELGGGFSYLFPAIDVMNRSFWIKHEIPVGSIIYFSKEITDNGIDAPAHVAIYRGNIGVSGDPVFADFAYGMRNGPMLNRSLKAIGDGLYFDANIKGWDLKKLLPTYIFDVVGMLNLSPKGIADFQSSTEFVSTDSAYLNVGFSDRVEPWAKGGAIPPNTAQVTQYDAFLTVNLFDGTTALFEKQGGAPIQVSFDSSNRMELYAILGRGLKVNKTLSELYANSDWGKDGSHYDGKAGIYYYANGVPRTTYTPPFMAEFVSTGDVINFGLIGGYTNIAFINALINPDGQGVVPDGRHSHYTIHAVPQDTPDQDVLLREPDLEAANDPSSGRFGPLRWPTLNRSSGCINFDRPSWYNILVPRLNGYKEQGKSVLVIFTYQSVDQDQLIRSDHYMMSDPFSNLSVKNTWEYSEIHDARTFAPGTGT